MPRGSSRELPPCGFAFDDRVCQERVRHLCLPRAAKVIAFFSEILVHTKGRYSRVPFVPTSWQRTDILEPLFGTIRFEEQLQTWVRQYNLGFLEVARKQGKSEIVAGAGLYLLCADDEEGAEVYGCACDRDQAGAVYRVAKRMVELSPVLSKRLRVIDSGKRIIDPKTESFYQVIASDGAGNLGWNPHGVLFDEVITQPNRELWDALKTGMGTRDQPLMLAATTAGNDPASMAAEEHLHSERVVRDPTVDPYRFVFMRNTPSEADWRDEKNWYHANPALGKGPGDKEAFLRIDVLRAEAKEAESSASKQNAFRQFRLNQWVRQTIRWLDLGVWDHNAGLVVEEQLEGRECFGGLDLASTSDFSALVLLFPGEEEDHLLARFWLPEGALERRGNMRDQIEAWAREGFVRLTPGDVIDQDVIRDDIAEDASRFIINSLGYDRWNASQLIRDLEDGGLNCQGVAQTTNELNAPSRELERLLGVGRLRHGGQPVLRWMVDNVTAFLDSNGNLKPDRKRSREKIDGVVALVMAIRQAMAAAQEGGDFAVFLGMSS